MPVFGKKKRELEAQIQSLATERDGLIAERDRLGQAMHETAQQRDAANAEIDRMNGELARFGGELEAAREDITRLLDSMGFAAAQQQERALRRSAFERVREAV